MEASLWSYSSVNGIQRLTGNCREKCKESDLKVTLMGSVVNCFNGT